MKNLGWIFFVSLVALAAAYFFGHIIIYIIIAGIFSLIAQPFDDWLGTLSIGKFSFSPTLSAGLTLLVLFCFFTGLGMIFTPLIMEEARIISGLRPQDIMNSMSEPIAFIEQQLEAYHLPYTIADVQDYIREKMSAMLTATNFSQMISSTFSVMGDLIIAFFSIVFLTFFFLRDRKVIADSALSVFFLRKYESVLRTIINESEALLKRYFIGLVTEMLIMFTLISLGLWIAGVNQALLIALFACIINVIPYVGPMIGGVFALMVGFTTQSDLESWSLVWRVVTVFSIANMVDVFLLQPLIYSSSVKAHPAEIFIVILAGAALGGIPGMILAVPAYTVLRVITKEFFDKGPAQ